MVDRHFAHPRRAGIYDALDADRSDLLVYEELIAGFGAGSGLDVGCGNGAFAVILARRGLAVTGVDPAAASLDVARRKPGASHVRWIHGQVMTSDSTLRFRQRAEMVEDLQSHGYIVEEVRVGPIVLLGRWCSSRAAGTRLSSRADEVSRCCRRLRRLRRLPRRAAW